MYRRATAVLACVVLMAQSFSCTVHSDSKYPIDEVDVENFTETIEGVVFHDGTVVKFADPGGRLSPDGTEITGHTNAGLYTRIPTAEIDYVQIRRISVGGTILATFGVVLIGLAALVGIILVSSCPFVYSDNGDQFVLDAEPLGGTVSRGLERADLSHLEHLRAIDGRYSLLVRNETEEIQYLDEMKLVVVDHDSSAIVRTDLEGNLHLVRSPASAVRAVDEDDRDLMNFLKKSDGIYWQSRLPDDDSWKDKPRRHQLTFYFRRPDALRTARLIVNAGTSLWGADMVREMLQLRGDKISEWHDAIAANGKTMQELIDFNLREELYFMRYYVREGDEWRFQGFVPGGGPLAVEDRVLPIDLSNVRGDTVAVRVMPPRGFWTIDYVGLDSGLSETTQGITIPVSRAFDKTQGDVTALLSAPDGERYVMPRVGDEATLEFAAPAEVPGLTRTIFLDTRGYYEVKIDEHRPENTALIKRFLSEPGAIVDYALEAAVRFARSTQARN